MLVNSRIEVSLPLLFLSCYCWQFYIVSVVGSLSSSSSASSKFFNWFCFCFFFVSEPMAWFTFHRWWVIRPSPWGDVSGFDDLWDDFPLNVRMTVGVISGFVKFHNAFDFGHYFVFLVIVDVFFFLVNDVVWVYGTPYGIQRRVLLDYDRFVSECDCFNRMYVCSCDLVSTRNYHWIVYDNAMVSGCRDCMVMFGVLFCLPVWWWLFHSMSRMSDELAVNGLGRASSPRSEVIRAI